MGDFRQYIYYLLMAGLFTSCIGVRYLSPGEQLVSKKSKIQGVKGSIKEDMQNLDQVQPNKKLFGFLPNAHLAHIYQAGKRKFEPEEFKSKIDEVESVFGKKIAKTNKERRKSRLLIRQRQKTDKLRQKIEEGNWLMRIGEQLAVFDESVLESSVLGMETYLSNKGFLRNSIDYQVIAKSPRRVFVKYDVNSGPRYLIDSVQYQIPDERLSDLIRHHSKKSLLLKGRPYDQSNIKLERDRIYELATNNGYYTFNKQYISFLVDTTVLGNYRILLTTQIQNPKKSVHQIFKIDSVNFMTGAPSPIGVNSWNSVKFNRVNYLFADSRYDPKVLDNRLFINQGDLFSRKKTLETQRQLSFLDAFKFVNVNYDSVGVHGLVANIFTRPMKKFETTNEVGIISQSGRPGPFINTGLKIRNAFGGLEVVQLSANFTVLGIESVEDKGRNYSQRLLGGQVITTFPKFLFPVTTEFRKTIGAYNPQTQLALGFNYEDRVDEYERSRIEAKFSYNWRVRDNVRFTLSPFNGSYIDVRKIEPDFSEFLDVQDSLGNGALRAAFNSSFISSSSLETTFNRNEYGSNQFNSSFVRLFLESGGTFLNLTGDDIFGADSTFSLFQWLKVQVDYRNLFVIDAKTNVAFRFQIGLAHPYKQGNMALPYDKRFYLGGSNSLRAWPVRRLGPGSFGNIRDATDSNGPAEISYRLEQGGDLIIESSLEYRRKLVGFVDYALFLDVGNVWIVGSDAKVPDEQNDNGSFRFDKFFREFAVGTGLGLRFDFSFMIFRLDGAMQVVDPAQAPGERFVLDDINIFALFGKDEDEKSFFKNKTNLNLGIGFPF